MVDTANRLIPTNAVRESMSFVAFHSLTNILPVCGACKTGNLIPLFATRTPQKPKNSSNGKMTAAQPRGASYRTIKMHTESNEALRFTPPGTRPVYQCPNRRRPVRLFGRPCCCCSRNHNLDDYMPHKFPHPPRCVFRPLWLLFSVRNPEFSWEDSIRY